MHREIKGRSTVKWPEEVPFPGELDRPPSLI